MRVMLVGATGGDLAQLVSMRPWWILHDRHWVAVDEVYARSTLAGEEVTWAHGPTARDIGNAVRNLLLARRLLRIERPDVVVSTCTGLAPAYFLVARALGIRTAFIEAFGRIGPPSLAGALCYCLSDVFCTQRETQAKYYPGAITIGATL